MGKCHICATKEAALATHGRPLPSGRTSFVVGWLCECVRDSRCRGDRTPCSASIISCSASSLACDSRSRSPPLDGMPVQGRVFGAAAALSRI